MAVGVRLHGGGRRCWCEMCGRCYWDEMQWARRLRACAAAATTALLATTRPSIAAPHCNLLCSFAAHAPAQCVVCVDVPATTTTILNSWHRRDGAGSNRL